MDDNPTYLTVEQARDKLAEWGMYLSLHQVRRMATENALPFFKLGARLWISESVLRSHLERLGREAAQERATRGRRKAQLVRARRA